MAAFSPLHIHRVLRMGKDGPLAKHMPFLGQKSRTLVNFVNQSQLFVYQYINKALSGRRHMITMRTIQIVFSPVMNHQLHSTVCVSNTPTCLFIDYVCFIQPCQSLRLLFGHRLFEGLEYSVTPQVFLPQMLTQLHSTVAYTFVPQLSKCCVVVL